MNKLYSNKLIILSFLLPALILFCGILIAPLAASGYFSFFDWKGIGPKTFIGLSNYRELFSSNAIGFMKALRNSLLLAALSVFLQLPLALALAVPLVIAVCALGILGVKSLTESLLYLQPFLVRVGKNFTAFVADAAVLLLSLPLCWQLERPAKKLFPQLCAKAKE